VASSDHALIDFHRNIEEYARGSLKCETRLIKDNRFRRRLTETKLRIVDAVEATAAERRDTLGLKHVRNISRILYGSRMSPESICRKRCIE
jgi:hypothetical protein